MLRLWHDAPARVKLRQRTREKAGKLKKPCTGSEKQVYNRAVKRHFLSGVNGGLQSVTVESNGILYSQAAGCQQYNGMFS